MRVVALVFAGWSAAGWFAAGGTEAAVAPVAAQDPTVSQVTQGLKVTWEPVVAEKRQKEGAHSYRARLLSLHVDKGESPTPLLSPGMFRATFEGSIPVPVRERYTFRVFGRGSVEMKLNGEVVVQGRLRPDRAVESQSVRLKKGENELFVQFDSTAFGEGSLQVQWMSPEFTWEPVPPAFLRSRLTDEAIARGEQMRHGQQLFASNQCASCHLPIRPLGESAEGELEAKGPDLQTAGARIRPAWLKGWLDNPHAMRTEARMPDLGLSAQEIDHLAAWIHSASKPLPDLAFTAEDAERGAGLFLERGCVACHVAPKGAREDAALGDRIHLGFVPQKWHHAALVAYLEDPHRDYADNRMPNLKLSPEDARALAAHLVAGHVAAAEEAPRGDAKEGFRIALAKGCVRCHDMGTTEDNSNFRRLEEIKPEGGCLDAPGGKVPDFSLTAGEVAALKLFLPHAQDASYRRAPLDHLARSLTAQRCTSCHGLDGKASVWAQVVEKLGADTPVMPEQDPVAQGVPALTWVGGKLQPSWISRFLRGEQASVRPWMHARMPAFAREGASLAEGLVHEHGFTMEDEDLGASNAAMAVHGQKLVKMGEGFGCVQCHGVGKQPPVQVFERQGVNFADSVKRLRKSYFTRWMADPPRIDADSRMPKYADAKGKTAFGDVLDGDAAKQFEAVWEWMLTLK